MLFKIFLLFSLTSTYLTYAATAQTQYRFQSSELSFYYQSDIESLKCRHQRHTNTPWWKVYCGDKEFTVDIWLQKRMTKQGFENTLMYHASEGPRSSGQKLTQFRTHFTSFFSDTQTSQLLKIKSRLDIGNGLYDLIVETK